MSSKRVGAARASYLEVIAPESLQGIRFLFIEHDNAPPEQYIKVAASRNVVRVADQIRRQPFLESAFYVSDLVEPHLDAYDYRTIGDEKLLGRDCRLVEVVPKKPEDELYGKTIIAVDPRDHLALRRQFFDKKSAPIKVWTVTQVEKVDGYWTMMKQEMKNLQDNVASKLDVTAITFNVELSDAMFTPNYLLRE